MDRIITKAADSTYDTESRSDLPSNLPSKSPAEIGDSITIRGHGDRIKVTVLGVVDPAVIKSRGIKGMLSMLSGEDKDERDDLRCVAVKLRLRNLEDASDQGIIHVVTGGALFDSEGREHSSTDDTVEGCAPFHVPNRGDPPKVVCDAFEIPKAANPNRYVLAIGGGAAEWILRRSQSTVSGSKRDFSLEEQRKVLDAGADAWNAWRELHPDVEVHLAWERLNNRDLKGINFSGADLEGTNFGGSDLTDANFANARARGALFPQARVHGCDFSGCDLRSASFFEAQASGAKFHRALMEKTNLEKVQAYDAKFPGADLRSARAIEGNFIYCDFKGAKLEGANFVGALLEGAILRGVRLKRIQLDGAYLRSANLQSTTIENASAFGANLQDADLTGATVLDSDLSLVTLVNAKLGDATILNTRVFGISAWGIKGTPKRQDEIIISPKDHTRVTVNDLEVANFVYLLLNNEKIRNAIETIGRKGVLILGRFTERKHVLEAIKKEIGRLDLLPIVFDFERPTDRDFTETVMTLAGMSRFIIADITAPKSVPLELEATVPNYMVPFVPLIEEGERPFSMFEDLWKKYREWVLEPLRYESVEQLIRVFKKAVVDPANERLELLRVRKAEQLVTRQAADYESHTPIKR